VIGAAACGIGVGHAQRIGPAPGAVIACDRPELARLRATASRIEDRRSGFVGKELGRRFQDLEQPLMDRRQKPSCGAADPMGERRGIKLDALARINLRLTVKRAVVGILRHQHMRDQRLGR
jgi:hypothetical protein